MYRPSFVGTTKIRRENQNKIPNLKHEKYVFISRFTDKGTNSCALYTQGWDIWRKNYNITED